MLEVEWSGGEDFTEDFGPVTDDGADKSSTFHGTIDLICSSDEDYDSEITQLNSSVTPPKDTRKKAADPEVAVVINDMLDFVERNERIPEFMYDPDHPVKDEIIVKKDGSCNKPHCLKGCLCSSLGGRFPRGPTHCGRERCMFECCCQERGLQTMDDENHYTDKSKRKKKLPTRFKDVVLGKAYEKLHARTINEYFNGDEQSESDSECHRMTERMKTPSASSSKNPSPEPKTNDSLSSTKKKTSILTAFDKASIATVRRTLQERRVGFLSKTLNEEQTLADVQIWCTHHEKYSCLCINYVFFQKTNALLWKPSNASRYLANKVMYDILLKSPTPAYHEVYPYNHNTHSARTEAPITNYAIRNKDETFQSKRKMEIEYNVLSYSNSYMKFYVRKFPCVTKLEPVPSAEPYDKTLEVSGGMGEVVHVTKTKEKLILDVGVELKVDAKYTIDKDEEEAVESSEGDDGLKLKQPRRRRKPTQKMMQLEEERMKELGDEGVEEEAKKVVVPQEKKKRGRKPKHIVMMERRASELSDRSTIREPTPEVDIIRCSANQTKVVEESKTSSIEVKEVKEEPASPDYFSAESRLDMEDVKEEAIVCAPDVGIVASCGPSTPSVTTHVTTAPSVQPPPETDDDREFREDIPKPFLGFSDSPDNLEYEECDDDDPDSIHSKKVLILKPRKDGYPHSGLMCLTPGLGYVTVLEYYPGRIVINDPGVPDMKHTFDNLGTVNQWLNSYIRGKVAISPPDLLLQWILVKPGILKLKQVKPMDPSVFWNTTIVITPNGIVPKKSLETPSNSVLKQQLSEHSVFSPVIRRQIALREAASKILKTFVSNPKFNEAKLVPNPKSMLRQLLKRHLPPESDSPPRKVSIKETSVSFETADGCVTMHRLSPEADFTVLKPPCVQTPLEVARPDVEIHHQVTIRPLPSLTKISQFPPFKQTIKIQK